MFLTPHVGVQYYTSFRSMVHYTTNKKMLKKTRGAFSTERVEGTGICRSAARHWHFLHHDLPPGRAIFFF